MPRHHRADRDKQALRLLARGKSRAEVAARLGISVSQLWRRLKSLDSRPAAMA